MASALSIIIALLIASAGAELLVRSASLLALRAGVSPLFIGLTVVGFGTSSPELGASLTATLQGYNDVSVGNVIGSSTFNIAFILGITALICPIKIEIKQVRSDLLVAIAAAFIPFIALLFSGVIPTEIGICMVLALCAYLYRAYRQSRRAPVTEHTQLAKEVSETLLIDTKSQALRDTTWFNILLVIVSLTMLILGSKVFVEEAVTLARLFHISDLVIGLTIVSIGTSLPELVTSIAAARKKNADLAIGNVIGSNIFNMLGILGTCAIIKPQQVSAQIITIDTPMLVVLSLALLPIIKSDGCISRREGLLLVLSYFCYLVVLLSIAGQ